MTTSPAGFLSHEPRHVTGAGRGGTAAQASTAAPRISADLAKRQLEVLSTDYPGWDITCSAGPSGDKRWTATLIQELTPLLANAGVVEVVNRDSAMSLGSALTHQARLLHSVRRQAWHP